MMGFSVVQVSELTAQDEAQSQGSRLLGYRVGSSGLL